MTTQPLNTLADLDWHSVQCQSSRHDCTRRAKHRVEFHALDDCNDTGNPFGNDVELLCDECLDEERAAIVRYLRHLKRLRRDRCACLTCGAPIAEMGDVLRGVSAL